MKFRVRKGWLARIMSLNDLKATRIASLGSGSKGNATLVASREALIMVDCGLGIREATARMARLGITPEALDAILLTHEHGDHIRGVKSLARRYEMPVYGTAGTWLGGKLECIHNYRFIVPEQKFSIADMDIDPVTVPHDAREPIQFVITAGQHRIGLLTDLGHITVHVRQRFTHCDALFLECNHDLRMLAEGPYPPVLKRRVGGNWGHLANTQAKALLEYWGTDRLQYIVASHLSDKNNRPELAFDALRPLLDGAEERLHISTQSHGVEWQTLY